MHGIPKHIGVFRCITILNKSKEAIDCRKNNLSRTKYKLSQIHVIEKPCLHRLQQGIPPLLLVVQIALNKSLPIVSFARCFHKMFSHLLTCYSVESFPCFFTYPILYWWLWWTWLYIISSSIFCLSPPSSELQKVSCVEYTNIFKWIVPSESEINSSPLSRSPKLQISEHNKS